ncbi:MAG: hypothetical protein WC783_01215 [Candidatus Paceibacterota bacterium]|jgi:hypothetical protein
MHNKGVAHTGRTDPTIQKIFRTIAVAVIFLTLVVVGMKSCQKPKSKDTQTTGVVAGTQRKALVLEHDEYCPPYCDIDIWFHDFELDTQGDSISLTFNTNDKGPVTMKYPGKGTFEPPPHATTGNVRVRPLDPATRVRVKVSRVITVIE